MSGISIAGFSDSVKVPGFFAETDYNAGAVTAGSIPLVLLVVGTKTSAGSATANQDVVDIFSTGDADIALGPGSDAALQCYGALQTPGVSIKAAPVPEAGGSAAASAVIIVTGSWSSGGTLNFRVDGIAYSANALSTDTLTTFGDTVAAAVNGNGQGSCSATNTAGVVLLTRKSKGLRGNQGALYVDTSLLPGGMVVQIAGGTSTTIASGSNTQTLPQATISVASSGAFPSSGGQALVVSATSAITNGLVTFTGTGSGTLTGGSGGAGTLHTGDAVYLVVAMTGQGVRFTGGVGTESVATLLSTVVNTLQYDRIAPAQNDATNAEAWATFCNNQAAPLVGLTEHLIFAVNGTYANAVALAQTDLNAERAQVLWQGDGETYPAFVAATFGAIRTSTEQGDPDASYDDLVLPGVAPQSQKTDWPNINTQIAALNSGVTPLSTNANGKPYVVRSITSHSQDEFGNPQYTTLDTSEAVVPDYCRLVLKLLYLTVVKPANPRTGPDPAATQRLLPAGFMTPMLWTQQATNALMGLETVTPPILLPGSTAANPVFSEWDSAGQRVMSVCPVVPCPSNHAIGVSLRNVTSV